MAEPTRDWLAIQAASLKETERHHLRDDLAQYLASCCGTTALSLDATEDENGFPIVAFGDRGRATARSLLAEFDAVLNVGK